jgi:hypothetical protein
VSQANKIRNARGGLFFLILASILIIILVSVIFAWFMFLSGGFRESQHAVDSGSLNLARMVVQNPATALNMGTPESAFAQVAENRDGKFYANLNNINRMAAELFLIDANCAAMREENSSGPQIGTASEALHHALEDIQGNLAEQLAARANVISYYENTANENSIRMLETCSNKDIRIYQTDYRIGYTDRGSPSNVHLNDKQIPKAFKNKWDQSKQNWAAGVSPLAFGGDQSFYLRGYLNDVNPLGSKPIYFVPLKEGNSLNDISRCQPHLISESTMKRDMDTGPLAWHKPVPNAFGITMNTGTKYVDPLSSTASSSVVRSLRPTEGFYAQIPHGFIRIRNAPPQNVSFDTDEPHKDDVFNFIKQKPQAFAEGPPQRHYQKDSDPYIDNIIRALKNRQLPKDSDLKALKKPADLQEAKDFKKKSDKIDNHTYRDFPPLVPQEIGDAYTKWVPRAARKQSEQLHCYEAACFALLAARSTGALGDPFDLKPGMSGIAKFQPQRNPLPPTQKQFTKPMTLAEIFKESNSSVLERLKERCYQIYPKFSGDLKDIAGWTTETIPMGSSLYIYWDGTIDKETGQPIGALKIANAGEVASRAPWVASNQNAVPEGKPAAIDCTVVSIAPIENGGLDLKGDWQYDQPFDTYKGDNKLVTRNLALFLPASGASGLLGEVDLTAQFGATAQDNLGVQPGFSTHDISEKGDLMPKPLKVKGSYSGPS